jgi:Terminase small subunit
MTSRQRKLNGRQRKLNPRRRAFIVFFVNVPSPKHAAIAAGYAPKNADVTGAQLLADPRIKAEIERRFKLRAARLGITRELICQRFWLEANNYVDATPADRIKALDRLGFYLGLGRIAIDLNQGSGPAHDRPALRELLKLMPPEQLQKFEEAMRSLADAEAELKKRKLIEGQAQPVTEVDDGEDR